MRSASTIQTIPSVSWPQYRSSCPRTLRRSASDTSPKWTRRYAQDRLEKRPRPGTLFRFLLLGRGPKPGGFLVAESVSGEHEELSLAGPVQIQAPPVVCRHHSNVPPRSINPHDRRIVSPKGAWLAGIASSLRPPAKTQKAAVG